MKNKRIIFGIGGFIIVLIMFLVFYFSLNNNQNTFYTVSFEDENGVLIETQKIKSGNTILNPVEPNFMKNPFN